MVAMGMLVEELGGIVALDLFAFCRLQMTVTDTTMMSRTKHAPTTHPAVIPTGTIK